MVNIDWCHDCNYPMGMCKCPGIPVIAPWAAPPENPPEPTGEREAGSFGNDGNLDLAEALKERMVAEWHADDAAVDDFAAALKDKMAQSRGKGRSGWQSCAEEFLTEMLREHVDRGDMRDVGCIAMMIHQNRKRAAAGGAV